MSKTLFVKSGCVATDTTFPTIQAAVNSISDANTESVTIKLENGRYYEKLTIDKPYITLLGEDRDKTIITYDDYANMIMEDGSKRGTFRSYYVFVHTHDFTAENICFENSAGFGRLVGQALALYAEGDRLHFKNCKMLGSQDTIFTGPLPPTEKMVGGFTGPTQFEPRVNGRHYYENCYIRGDVDFIFGSATAFFENCEIFSKKTDDLPPAAPGEKQKNYGYITAASTAEGQEFGYVFKNCRLTSDCPKESVYLGRPWRNFAKTVFVNCEIGEHIRAVGWHDWNKPEAHETILYAEYKSFGPGAPADTAVRASFSKQLSDDEAGVYTKANVLGGNDNWMA